MIRLSIIRPFYNVEQYIAQCLDSVYQQDIPEEEYEVICVNDASSDKSREIVKEYQKKHKNLILVEHDVNKKLGAARNTGRSIARGKYIWNVDSDDMIVPNCLKEMLEICEENDLDVLVFSHKLLVDGTIKDLGERDAMPSTACMSGVEFMRQYVSMRMHIISSVWKQLFRREYLDVNSIYSPEINMSEDVPYTFKAIALAQRLQAVSESYYLYRKNPQSIGAAMAKAPSAIAAYESCFIASKALFCVAKELQDAGRDVSKAIESVGIWCFYLYVKYVSEMTNDQRHKFISLCRENFWHDKNVLMHVGHKKRVEYLRFVVVGK